MTEVRIPKLAVSMEEGTLTAWLVADGAAVEAGQPIYILATDKVETEIEAPVSGRLRQLKVADADYGVGEVIGSIE
jgi:pyruvate/2-oxoglutarate dehydrogenase complex dihydrolipoamide acyltransferase (E2) component